jgi:hypothetical protein
MTLSNRTYTELLTLDTLLGRFEYLSLKGVVGCETFGHARWINQRFYTSLDWRRVRRDVVARDEGFNMGLSDYPIQEKPIVHHMNPLTIDDLMEGTAKALDPEFLISVSHGTHNAIHYGDSSLLPQAYIPRHPGDTKLW